MDYFVYETIMSTQSSYKSECFVYLLSKAYQKGHGLVQKRLLPYSLTNIQYVVLELLWVEEGLTASEIGKRLVIDKATLSGVLDRMVDSEWLLREQEESDKRLYRLYPSEKANGLKDELISERKKANEELLSGFSTEERVVLRRLLLDLL
jgi:DNA-binding MarR family transcriptional regulator